MVASLSVFPSIMAINWFIIPPDHSTRALSVRLLQNFPTQKIRGRRHQSERNETPETTIKWCVVVAGCRPGQCMDAERVIIKLFVIHLCDCPKRLIWWWTAFHGQIGGVSRLCQQHRSAVTPKLGQSLFERLRTRYSAIAMSAQVDIGRCLVSA